MENFSSSLSGIWVAMLCSVLGMLFVGYLVIRILKKNVGPSKVQEIVDLIHDGAMAFLKREYMSIAIFVALIGTVIFFFIAKKTAFAFVIGAACSILAGNIGMQIATRANGRTAQGASKSFNEALGIAFPGGAVMGISVVSIGLFGLTAVYLLLIQHAGLHHNVFMDKIMEATQLLVGFSMGASLVALFARVGGGIYTKAADVGADLVGKVEAGIPEDDPRNPAVIADNVGDNVGDVAGMGADLFESYVGAIISGLVIAMTSLRPELQFKGVLLVLLMSGWGILSSMIGVFFVRTDEKSDPQRALNTGLISSAVMLMIGAIGFVTWYGRINALWSIASGLLAGLIIGFTAQYYTTGKVVRAIANEAKTGPATTIISGLAYGMYSTVIPVVVIAIATVVSFMFSGIFGIALSAIGMLAITGMTVAVDAYGPIADNAAGIAEMAELGPEVRKRAERLDAVGNTTAAIGKGFAIGSAALTALALFTAFAQVVGLSLSGVMTINIMKPEVIAGLFIGGVIPFVFSAATMRAVGKAAYLIVEEVRRQFKEIPGLMEGKAKPDSARCVDITTKGALHEMIFPGIMAVLLPVVIGTILGMEALGGFLAGSLVTGVPLAIFLANSGGAWDNAKKYVEEGNLGGKGSDVHKATVIGDTVGDPLKDTSGPSLNILLKLMAIVSLVFAPMIIKLHDLIFKMF